MQQNVDPTGRSPNAALIFIAYAMHSYFVMWGYIPRQQPKLRNLTPSLPRALEPESESSQSSLAPVNMSYV